MQPDEERCDQCRSRSQARAGEVLSTNAQDTSGMSVIHWLFGLSIITGITVSRSITLVISGRKWSVATHDAPLGIFSAVVCAFQWPVAHIYSSPGSIDGQLSQPTKGARHPRVRCTWENGLWAIRVVRGLVDPQLETHGTASISQQIQEHIVTSPWRRYVGHQNNWLQQSQCSCRWRCSTKSSILDLIFMNRAGTIIKKQKHRVAIKKGDE